MEEPEPEGESYKTKEYSFKLEILDQDGNVDTSVNTKYGKYDFVEGSTTFTLKDKQQALFKDMPKDTRFREERPLKRAKTDHIQASQREAVSIHL